MGISKGYSTPLAMDLMRAFAQGKRYGAILHGGLGLAFGLVGGFGLAMYIGTKLEDKK